MNPDKDIFDLIKEAVINLDEEQLINSVNSAVDKNFNPQSIIEKGLAQGLQIVGENFEKRELFLPEMLISSNIVNKALDILNPLLLNKSDFSFQGKVLIGTARGDIHDIGKNIVVALLKAARFEVYDLGVNVIPEEFVKNAIDFKPDIIGISALISPAASGVNETIALIKDHKINSKIIIGGAAITQETADSFGADAYGSDAWAGIEKMRKLMKEVQNET